MVHARARFCCPRAVALAPAVCIHHLSARVGLIRMEHDARLALVLVGSCVHVLRCVAMAIELGHFGLSGCRAQSDKSCIKSQTADHIATGGHCAAPVAKWN